jgi:hypothetical protein
MASLKLVPLRNGHVDAHCGVCNEKLLSDVSERAAYLNSPVALAHYEAKHAQLATEA